MKYESVTKAYLLSLRAEIAKLDLAPKTKNKLIEILKTTSAYANEVYDLPDNAKILKRFKLIKKEPDTGQKKMYHIFIEDEDKLAGAIMLLYCYMTSMFKFESDLKIHIKIKRTKFFCLNNI